MMATVVGNFAEVNAALAAVAARVGAADEQVAGAGARTVALIAAQRAPRFTGHLAASVDAEGGEVVVDTPYAVYQEYGTRHHAAQPFLGPARDQAEPLVYREAEGIYTVATR